MVRARASMEMPAPTIERILSVPTGLTTTLSGGAVVVFRATKQAKLVR